jgi:hypothetical protein
MRGSIQHRTARSLTEAYLDAVAQLRRESISLSKEALSDLARDIIARGGRGTLERKQLILAAVLKARAAAFDKQLDVSIGK